MFKSMKFHLRTCLVILAVITQGVHLSGCGVANQPDHDIYYVCAHRADDVRSVALIVSETAMRFGYRYADRGEEARSNLLYMDANPAIIPDEAPILAVVRNNRHKAVLVMSNFTLNAGELEIDFLYYGAEDRRSQFSQDVLAALSELSAVRVIPANNEVGDHCAGQ